MDTKTPFAALTDWRIEPVDPSLESRLRARIDGKAKPLPAHSAAWKISRSSSDRSGTRCRHARNVRRCSYSRPITASPEGVSLYPASVTAAMVATYLAGRAGVSALARACNVNVQVVDAGVDADLPAHPELIDAKIRRGSRNAMREPALTIAEATDCLTCGASIVANAIEGGTDIVAIGEMGIGNTTSAALLMHRLAPAPLADCVGAGAGLDADGIARSSP